MCYVYVELFYVKQKLFDWVQIQTWWTWCRTGWNICGWQPGCLWWLVHSVWYAWWQMWRRGFGHQHAPHSAMASAYGHTQTHLHSVLHSKYKVNIKLTEIHQSLQCDKKKRQRMIQVFNPPCSWLWELGHMQHPDPEPKAGCCWRSHCHTNRSSYSKRNVLKTLSTEPHADTDKRQIYWRLICFIFTCWRCPSLLLD